MDKTTFKKIKQYSDIVRHTISVKKIVLYGSYAKNSETKTSDIDIAVIVDSINGDYLDLSAHLFELANKVDVRIEPILLNENSDTSGFIESITKYGKEI